VPAIAERVGIPLDNHNIFRRRSQVPLSVVCSSGLDRLTGIT